MGATERSDLFWVDDINGQGLKVQRRDGQIETRDGFRFQWVRNELGALYLKSLGQIGYHLSPRYTLEEYVKQCRVYAEAHVAALSPEVRNMVGVEVALAGMFEMAPPPKWDDSPVSGAISL